MKIQAQREEEILQKIKQKMDRIKATQRKIQPAPTAPKTHFQGKWWNKSRYMRVRWEFSYRLNDYVHDSKHFTNPPFKKHISLSEIPSAILKTIHCFDKMHLNEKKKKKINLTTKYVY